MIAIQSVSKETKLLYVGSSAIKPLGTPEELPVYPATAYAVHDLDDYDLACGGGKYYYNREGNPNRDALALAISSLEHGEDTLICASGMAAISTALISLLKSGSKVVVNRSVYGETREVLDIVLSRYGVQTVYADFLDEEALRRKSSGASLLYTEVITNPLIEVVDLARTAQIAHENGALLVVDSTFTTPFLVRPLEHEADAVIHSLTKYFGGHGDLTGGSITASRQLIEQIRPQSILLGGCLSAQDAWLTLRSMRTMEMRVTRQNDNALKLARALEKHTKVADVYYPGLEGHPQHKLAKQLLGGHYGAMLSFRVEDDREKVNRFIRKLTLIRYLGTLGGIRTSFAHPATAFRSTFTQGQLEVMGLYEGLLRISVGAEAPEDIIADVEQALEVF